MPNLIPSRKFVKDADRVRDEPALAKKLGKALALLETNPHHPGLHIERIVNDPAAWSARIDGRHRLSFEPTAHLPGGNPDWAADLFLLRILDHDDLYRTPR